MVVSFDLCSSSKMLEDLTLSGNVDALGKLFAHLNMFVRAKTKELGGNVYKFTGDGWILLFPQSVDGKRFVTFLAEMCQFCHHVLRSTVIPVLEATPERIGIAIGLDSGPLLQIMLDGRSEWVGRPINVACRLQNSIKDKDGQPEYKALISKQLYEKLKDALATHEPVKVTRMLRNIRNGAKFECIKVTLFRPLARIRAPLRIRRRLRSPVQSALPASGSLISLKGPWTRRTPD